MPQQRWEYCVVSGFWGPNVGSRKDEVKYPGASLIGPKGYQFITDFKNRPKGQSEEDAVAQFIYNLGEDGWEMVGSGPYGLAAMSGGPHQLHSLYFKRPKE